MLHWIWKALEVEAWTERRKVVWIQKNYLMI